MKLGNISQSIVPVPNFFMDQKGRELETFHLYNKTDSNFYKNKSKMKSKLNLNPLSIQNNNTESKIEEISSHNTQFTRKFKRQNSNPYFRDRDVLTTFYNLNINNNPRNFSRQWIECNREKYIPVYLQKQYPDYTEMKKTYFPDIIDLNSNNKDKHEYKKIMSLKCLENFYNYKNYKKRENTEEFLSPNLREDIKYNTKNLIDRINMNYDIKKWTDFDSRTTFNRFFQTAYSPLNSAIKNSESLKNTFSKILKEKALSLKVINPQTKKIIEKTMNNIDNNKIDYDNNEMKYDSLIENCSTNLLKLKYNNSERPKYNSKDKQFINDNKYITRELNKTKLYKNFPSKTREEFNEKNIIIPKHLLKNSKYQGNVILRNKFGNDEEDNANDKMAQNDFLKTMWKRPLHQDAYRLHE